MRQLIYRESGCIENALEWANALIGDYLPDSDVWLIDDIVQFEWQYDSETSSSGTLILLVELEPAVEMGETVGARLVKRYDRGEV